MKNKIVNSTLLLALITISGCSVEPYNQGNMVNIGDMKQMVRKSKREVVESKFGAPSMKDHKLSNVVYYIGATGHKKPLMQPNITKSVVLKVEYDNNDVLVGVSEVK